MNENTVADPDLVATRYPLASAGFFFDANKIWTVCNNGSSDAVITAVTKKLMAENQRFGRPHQAF